LGLKNAVLYAVRLFGENLAIQYQDTRQSFESRFTLTEWSCLRSFRFSDL